MDTIQLTQAAALEASFIHDEHTLLSRLFDRDIVKDLDGFNGVLLGTSGLTVTLPGGTTLYPHIDPTSDAEPHEMHVVPFEQAAPDVAMLLGFSADPTKDVASPTFLTLFRSRVYDVDAYDLIGKLFMSRARNDRADDR